MVIYFKLDANVDQDHKFEELMISEILTVQALAVYVLDKYEVHGLRTVLNLLDLDLFAKVFLPE